MGVRDWNGEKGNGKGRERCRSTDWRGSEKGERVRRGRGVGEVGGVQHAFSLISANLCVIVVCSSRLMELGTLGYIMTNSTNW